MYPKAIKAKIYRFNPAYVPSCNSNVAGFLFGGFFELEYAKDLIR
jgi:hypothetical protein